MYEIESIFLNHPVYIYSIEVPCIVGIGDFNHQLETLKFSL